MSKDSHSPYITRRVFVAGTGLAAVGLYFGLYRKSTIPQGKPFEDYSAFNPTSESELNGLSPNVFIHVAPGTGLVSIVCHRSEMGQGIRSSLPVLMADELGASMDQVQILQGEGNKAYGDQNTDGSSSVRGVYTDMRLIAATARVMLVQAASEKMKKPVNELTAENNRVIHGSSGESLSFADLAIAAGELAIPSADQVKLRPDVELKRIGGALPLLDGPDYVSGKANYGADIDLPGKLIAVIARPPILGVKATSFDKQAALNTPGVKKVIELPHAEEPYGFQPFGGVAVLAENTWAAWKGRDALNVKWSHSELHGNYNSEEYKKALLKAVNEPGQVERKVGDVDTALKEAAKIVEAEYYVPHLPHLTMEPPAAIANYSVENGGSCEVWASTQNPQTAKTEVARITGLPEERVMVHVTLLGGGFGRKSKGDFCGEAAFLSKAAGVPVRVQWTRTDDIHNDYLNSVNAQKLTAGLSGEGEIVAWRHRTAFPPIATTFNPKAQTPGAGDLQQGVLDLMLDVPNILVETGTAIQHTRIGWLRSVYNIFHAFAVNSFVDELSYARKKDPLQNALDVFGPAKTFSLKDLGIEALKNYGASLEDQPVDGVRLQNVLKRVAEISQWDSRQSQKNRGFGLAVHRSFNSYAAVVASVRQDDKSTWPQVDEVWISLDAGQVINPDRVHAQLEGSVINGMSHLFFGGVTFDKGAVVESNFDGAQQVRNKMAPRKIHTDIFNSNSKHGGVGEPGVPPVAPAIANAIFALTGKRVREFDLLSKSFS